MTGLTGGQGVPVVWRLPGRVNDRVDRVEGHSRLLGLTGYAFGQLGFVWQGEVVCVKC